MEDKKLISEKICIGVSSCLLGEEVRWNGEHKQHRYTKDILGRFFTWIPICPEMEVGMGVPRETVSLYGDPENPKMIGSKSGTNWTAKMNIYLTKRTRELKDSNLCGYIFKSKSPSCGLERVPVYSEPGSSSIRRSRGMFANAFIKRFPLIPVEDEERLNDPKIRGNFIVRVFSYHRLMKLFEKKANAGVLVKFHTEHKFLLLSHNRKNYQILGKLVGGLKKGKWMDVRNAYSKIFMETLTFKSTAKKNTDVLMHMMGFLKNLLSTEEKRGVLEAIESYRNEWTPLIVPITLIQHYARKHEIEYLQSQIYLNPHPKELLLRNHV